MGYNKKILSEATKKLDKPQKIKNKNTAEVQNTFPFESSEGFLNGPPPPGTNYRIPGNSIYNPTPYNILARGSNGQEKIIAAGDTSVQNFGDADYVDEFQIAKKGGEKKFSRSLSATNKLFKKNPLIKKPKSKKKKTFDPNAKRYQEGGYVDLDLDDDEILELQKGGYIVEYLDDPSIPELTKAQTGGQKDSWGRPSNSIWYGFDPGKKQFTTKDAWGRSPGSEWYGFNPELKTWTKGNKVQQAVKKESQKVQDYYSQYMNSPIYKEMLGFNPDIDSKRKENLGYPFNLFNPTNTIYPSFPESYKLNFSTDTPSVSLIPQPKNNPNTGGRSYSKSGNIEIMPKGLGVKGLLPHEWSHSIDRPRGLDGQRLIPQKDIDYIKKTTVRDEDILKLPRLQDYSSYTLDKLKRDYPEWIQNEIDWKNYVGEPTEVRARLNDIRYQSKQRGLYDPFTQKVTPEIYEILKNTEFEKGENKGFDALQQLKGIYTDEQIMYMLNNISKNIPSNNNVDYIDELPVAKYGGLIKAQRGRQQKTTYFPGAWANQAPDLIEPGQEAFPLVTSESVDPLLSESRLATQQSRGELSDMIQNMYLQNQALDQQRTSDIYQQRPEYFKKLNKSEKVNPIDQLSLFDYNKMLKENPSLEKELKAQGYLINKNKTRGFVELFPANEVQQDIIDFTINQGYSLDQALKNLEKRGYGSQESIKKQLGNEYIKQVDDAVKQHYAFSPDYVAPYRKSNYMVSTDYGKVDTSVDLKNKWSDNDIITLARDKDFIDSFDINNFDSSSPNARNDERWNSQIVNKLRSGKWGWKPKTNELVNLEKSEAYKPLATGKKSLAENLIQQSKTETPTPFSLLGTNQFWDEQEALSNRARDYNRLGEDAWREKYSPTYEQTQQRWQEGKVPVEISSSDAWRPKRTIQDNQFYQYGFEQPTGVDPVTGETITQYVSPEDYAGRTAYMSPEESEKYNKQMIADNMYDLQTKPGIWHLPGMIAAGAFLAPTWAGGAGGLGSLMSAAPISSLPSLTAGNALNAAFAYDVLRDDGLIEQAYDAAQRGDYGEAGTDALFSALTLAPYAKGARSLYNIGKGLSTPGTAQRIATNLPFSAKYTSPIGSALAIQNPGWTSNTKQILPGVTSRLNKTLGNTLGQFELYGTGLKSTPKSQNLLSGASSAVGQIPGGRYNELPVGRNPFNLAKPNNSSSYISHPVLGSRGLLTPDVYKDLLVRNYDEETGTSDFTIPDITTELSDAKFNPFSPGYQAQQELSNLATFGRQPLLNKDQFYTDNEVADLINKEIKYRNDWNTFEEMNPEEPGMNIMRALSGDNSRDELFSNLFPNSYMPNFRSKFLLPNQSAFLNDAGLSNPTFTNKGMLNKTSLKSLTKGEDTLPRAYKDLLDASKADTWLKTADPKTVVGEMRGGLGLKLEEINNATPEQLEKWRQQVVTKMYGQAVERWKRDVNTPLKGYDAMRTLSPNKNGGELPEAQLGQLINYGSKALGKLPYAKNVSGLMSSAGKYLTTQTPLKNTYKLLGKDTKFYNPDEKPNWLRGYEQQWDPQIADLTTLSRYTDDYLNTFFSTGYEAFSNNAEKIHNKYKPVIYDLLEKQALAEKSNNTKVIDDINKQLNTLVFNRTQEISQAEANLFKNLIPDNPFSQKLGSGSFGSVYEVPNINRTVKLGKIPSNEDAALLVEKTKGLNKSNIAIPTRIEKLPSGEYATVMNKVDPITKPYFDNPPTLETYNQLIKDVEELQNKGVYLDFNNKENIEYNPNTGKFNIYDLNTTGYIPKYKDYDATGKSVEQLLIDNQVIPKSYKLTTNTKSLENPWQREQPNTLYQDGGIKLLKSIPRQLSLFDDVINTVKPTSLPQVINASGFTMPQIQDRLQPQFQGMNPKLFENTVFSPSGKLYPTPQYSMHDMYDPKPGGYTMPFGDYRNEFNSRLDVLNDIIEKGNTSGIPYESLGLTEEGFLKFKSPQGISSWGVRTQPGSFTNQDLEEVIDPIYWRSIPGLEMNDTSQGVFGQGFNIEGNIPRGTGSYRSINDYMKKLNLGRVKSGFNAQTPEGMAAWEKFIKNNEAMGYFETPDRIFGIMKQEGGAMELELSPEEIKWYESQGYTVEDIA